TNLGGFAERISPGVTGYLFEPGVEGMLSCLRDIHANREGLQRIRAQLVTIEMRSAKEMLADYHRLLPLPDGLSDPAWLHRKRAFGSPEDVRIAQALALSGQWKEIRNLRATVEMKSARLDACIRETDDARSRLADLERALQETRQALALRDAEIIALHKSTSWRVTGPLRRGMILARCLRPVLRQPSDAPAWLRALLRAWRADGIGGVKRALLQWPEHGQGAVRTESLPVVEAAAGPSEESWQQRAFRYYRASMSDDIRAAIATRIQAMDAPPLISILVPAYNTPESMLREMLDSVCAQLYPHWQLCIADDGSSEPHVRAVLEAHAARDARIRLDFATENGGVSRATNRALAMAE
ncbi:MAG: glycosyltransferase, partial [Thiobacillus sp.]|nr:glycosyltransferase [Thiobacillus sp.]